MDWSFWILSCSKIGECWRKWIEGCLSTVSFLIIINGRPRGKFKGEKDLEKEIRFAHSFLTW